MTPMPGQTPPAPQPAAPAPAQPNTGLFDPKYQSKPAAPQPAAPAPQPAAPVRVTGPPRANLSPPMQARRDAENAANQEARRAAGKPTPDNREDFLARTRGAPPTTTPADAPTPTQLPPSARPPDTTPAAPVDPIDALINDVKYTIEFKMLTIW